MYDANGYDARPGNRRTWLIAGAVLAAIVVVLSLATYNALSNRTAPADPIDATATTDEAATDGPTSSSGTDDDGGAVVPATGAGGGESETGDDAAQEPAGQEEEPAEEPDDEPAPPLSVDVTVDTITPGGQCFAAGTITVDGGTYPMTVHYQWRRLVLGGGLDGEPVSAVANHEFSEPGEIHVQTNDLPEDGTNVYLVVTGPKQAGSGLVEYDGCTDPADDIVLQGN